MRAVASEVAPSRARIGSRAGARAARLRRERLRSLALEALETRQLLATLPPLVQAASNPQTTLSGSYDAPSIAIDPSNPSKMVAAWFNGSGVGAAYSTDGGATWNTLGGSFGNGAPDPSSSSVPPPPLPLTTDVSIAFDAHDNFYLSDTPRKADYSAGWLNVESWRFDGGAPVQTVTDNLMFPWTAAAAAVFKPSVTADANQKTNNGVNDPTADFTLGVSPNVRHVGAVFVTASTGGTAFFVESKDGGATFPIAKGMGGTANGGTLPGVSPHMVISQGRPADMAGFGAKDTGVLGGLMTAVWDVNNQAFLPAFDPNTPDGIATQSINYGNYTPGAGVALNTPIAEAQAPRPPSFPGAPGVTTIPLNVVIPDLSFSLANITATVALFHGDLSEVSIVLQTPTGVKITLLNNKVDKNGVPVAPPQGDTGSNLGIDGGGNAVGTTFDDGAATSITAAPIGPGNAGKSYQPEQAGGLAALVGAGRGAVQGTWKLIITDFRPDASPGSQVVKGFSLSLADKSGLKFFPAQNVASTYVWGSVDSIKPYPNAANATPKVNVLPDVGYGPAPVIAADSTLGALSPHAGRLYIAYVDRNNNAGNPTDHTDIALLYSDDNGQTWTNQGQVSDGNAATDGFSEAGSPITGRPQFQPALAVDPTTGTVVLSYYDARNDAARTRVATYVQASIDGGQSWSAGAYANASKTTFDAIKYNPSNPSASQVILGPIPDNQGAGDPTPTPGQLGDRDTTFGFGDHQGLAVFGGQVFPAWAGNRNSGTGLFVTVGHMQVAGGPRVVRSTMGPVGEAGDTVNPPNPGGPQASNLRLVFDRPVDWGTIDGSNVSFTYEDVNGNVTNLGSLGAVVTPVVTNPSDPNQNGHFGYTTFNVAFAAQSAVGTYSYKLTPTPSRPIASRISYVLNTGTVSSQALDQNANGTPGENPGDVYAVPTTPDTLPLVVPGPHVIATTVQNQKAGALDNEVLNATASYIDVKFDRAMNPFDGSKVVRMTSPAGSITGPFTVTQLGPQTFRVGFPTQQLSGTYTVVLASSITDTLGEPLDSNLNAGVYRVRGINPYATDTANTYTAPVPAGGVAIPDATANPPGPDTPGKLVSTLTVPDDYVVTGITVAVDITHASDPDLKITLVGPDGTVLPDGTILGGAQTVLAQNTGSIGTHADFHTTFDDSVGLPSIDSGPPPFFGHYNPHTSLTVSFVTGSYHAKGDWKLVIEDDVANGVSGTLTGWSIRLLNKVQSGSTGLGEPVADQASLGFRIFTDATNNQLSAYNWTSVGPAPMVNTNNGAVKAGRVGAIAVDPSDPSGNTVYVGGASGGVWKTTNFMTTSPTGPTWIPLTDFGPTSGINVGTITVFPQGGDPTKSIVFVGLGEPDTNTKGYGFLRSTDGGMTWELLDSTNNTGAYAGRDKLFSQNSTVAYRIAVDPRLNSTTWSPCTPRSAARGRPPGCGGASTRAPPGRA